MMRLAAVTRPPSGGRFLRDQTLQKPWALRLRRASLARVAGHTICELRSYVGPTVGTGAGVLDSARSVFSPSWLRHTVFPWIEVPLSPEPSW